MKGQATSAKSISRSLWITQDTTESREPRLNVQTNQLYLVILICAKTMQYNVPAYTACLVHGLIVLPMLNVCYHSQTESFS